MKIKERIAVMQAYVDGADIQMKGYNDRWVSVPDPGFFPSKEYRVKPEEEYRPFRATEMELLIGKAIRYKDELLVIIRIAEYRIHTEKFTLTLKNLFEDATFIDGSRCGVKL